MKDAFLQVAEFERRIGRPLSSLPPSAPDLETIALRKQLITEEYKELIAALTVVEQCLVFGMPVTPEVLGDVADGSADLQFVCMGTDQAIGVDGPAVMAEVCRANLSKFDGGHWYDETGKLRKSPSFVPPDVVGVIKNQKPLSEIYGRELDSR